MHELKAILSASEQNIQRGINTFLATIVNTFGSTYRQKGAKMLITEQGEMIGTLSGGCLENDIFHYTKKISNHPLVINYDATKEEEDIMWGFGLGCNGSVQILLEKLHSSSHLSPLNLIYQCLNHKKIGAIATIFSRQGNLDLNIGSRVIVYPDNTTDTNINHPELLAAIASDTIPAKNTQLSTVHNYQVSSGSVEVFIEVIKPPISLIIFGAGRDALPVVKLAQAMGWEVTIVDCRAQSETYQRFEDADQIILTRRDIIREIISQQLSIDENTVTVVMTHNYLDDYDIVKFLLSTPTPYVGVMGSKNRIDKIIQDLNPTKSQLDKLYAPIGLDIGADTPAEIASAIIVEIQAVLNQRNGGFLKYRSQSLH